MNKIFIILKREYAAAVRTRGFIVSLVMLPIMMGGAFAVTMLTKDKVDLVDKTIVVIDESGSVGQAVVAAAEERNANELNDPESGEKKKPAYYFTVVDKAADFNQQKLELSDQIRSKSIHAFVHIGANVITPSA